MKNKEKEWSLKKWLINNDKKLRASKKIR